MTDSYDFELEYTFADDKRAELDRCLSLLLSTRKGTMPLNREFGVDMDFTDLPPETVKSLFVAEVVNAVAQFIPSVRVQEVTWSSGADGKLIPKVVITSA